MQIPHLRSIVLSCVLSVGLASTSQAAIQATFEGPGDGDDVAGVQIVRGWAFSDVTGTTITAVRLFIDGVLNTVIPCCSERGDVASSFPGEPNALNSGFGLTLNFNLLPSGSHTLRLDIQDSSGATSSRTHTITVARPGDFEFVDMVDLSSATVSRVGQDIVLGGVRFRKAGTAQVAEVATRLRWLKGLQGLGIVGATAGNAIQISSLQALAPPTIRAQTGAGLSGIVAAAVESPSNGQTGAGLAVIRGFVIVAAGRSIQRVQLLVDGNPSLTIPCCSERRDVATAFPTEPNALLSGFGLTFNYGLLSTGVHELSVEIEDSAGAVRKMVRGMLVRRVGDFEFLDNLDMSQSTVRLQGQTLIVDGAIAHDSVTGQTKQRVLRYRYDVASQGFQLVESHAREVMLGNLVTVVNGDTTSLDTLAANPGPDGISLPEAIEATNNTPPDEPVLMTFPFPGTMALSGPLPAITGGNLTIDGDVDGDGTPDVTLAGTTSAVTVETMWAQRTEESQRLTGGSHAQSVFSGIFTVQAGGVTIRGLGIRNFSRAGVHVTAGTGSEITDVAVVGLDIEDLTHDGIWVEGQPDATVSRVLLATNEMQRTFTGIDVSSVGINNSTQTQITITGNTILQTDTTGVFLTGGFEGAVSNTVSVIVADNIVTDAGLSGIALYGGTASGGNTVSAEIRGNDVRNPAQAGVYLTGGFQGADANTVSAVVTDNILTDAGFYGVGLEGGNASEDNTVAAVISGNDVRNPTLSGVALSGGFAGADANLVLAEVTDNMVTDAEVAHGISLEGGNASDGNTVTAVISRNDLRNLPLLGELLPGGFAGANANMVSAAVADNMVTETGLGGIDIVGGVDSSQNTVLGTVLGNVIQDSASTGIFQTGGWFSSGNLVDSVLVENVITNSGTGGIEIAGGTTRPREDIQSTQGATANMVTGTIVNNMVQDSLFAGLAVYGGSEDTNGAVVGNVAVQDLRTNTADGIVCADGITGNTATCTFEGNIDTSANALLFSSVNAADDVRTVTRPVTAALVQQLNTQITRLQEQEQALRTRVETIQDPGLRQQLHKLCDKLSALQLKLAARRDGRSPWEEHVSID